MKCYSSPNVVSITQFDKEKADERIAALGGGIARIKVRERLSPPVRWTITRTFFIPFLFPRMHVDVFVFQPALRVPRDRGADDWYISDFQARVTLFARRSSGTHVMHAVLRGIA